MKVQCLIRTKERYVVGDPFGGLLKRIPSADRAKLTEALRAPEVAQLGIGDFEIGTPGIVGTPIVIYR